MPTPLLPQKANVPVSGKKKSKKAKSKAAAASAATKKKDQKSNALASSNGEKKAKKKKKPLPLSNGEGKKITKKKKKRKEKSLPVSNGEGKKIKKGKKMKSLRSALGGKKKKEINYNDMETLIVYTDGSKGKHSSGIGIFLDSEHPLNRSISVNVFDSGKAEILAVHVALTNILEWKEYKEQPVVIRTDYLCLVNAMHNGFNGWKYSDLYADLRRLVERFPSVTFEHVRGHKGIIGNVEADQIAGRARKEGDKTSKSSLHKKAAKAKKAIKSSALERKKRTEKGVLSSTTSIDISMERARKSGDKISETSLKMNVVNVNDKKKMKSYVLESMKITEKGVLSSTTSIEIVGENNAVVSQTDSASDEGGDKVMIEENNWLFIIWKKFKSYYLF